MKITLKRLNDALLFEAQNDKGHKIKIDGPSEEEQGMRPMELMLSSIAACSSFDVVDILKKQRQELVDMRVNAEGIRPSEGYPKPFTRITLNFDLIGALDPSKVQRAIELSIEKYCSAAASLNSEVIIDYGYQIHST
jgi:putative redox protein